jgi:hypothetical protein
MLPTKFRFIWPSGFRGEDFFFIEEVAKLSWNIIHALFFSSPCQRQCELLPLLGVRRPLAFHILIFSSETPQSAWIIFQDNFATSSMKQALLVPSCTKKQCFREIFFSH